jgi:hypothetical protein
VLAGLLTLSYANLLGYPTEAVTRAGVLSGIVVAACAFLILLARQKELPPQDYQRLRWVIHVLAPSNGWCCDKAAPAKKGNGANVGTARPTTLPEQRGSRLLPPPARCIGRRSIDTSRTRAGGGRISSACHESALHSAEMAVPANRRSKLRSRIAAEGIQTFQLTKIDIAEALIRAAVRLFFQNEHPVPIYQLRARPERC